MQKIQVNVQDEDLAFDLKWPLHALVPRTGEFISLDSVGLRVNDVTHFLDNGSSEVVLFLYASFELELPRRSVVDSLKRHPLVSEVYDH